MDSTSKIHRELKKLFRRCIQHSGVCQCIHRHRTSKQLPRRPECLIQLHAQFGVSMHHFWHLLEVCRCLKSWKGMVFYVIDGNKVSEEYCCRCLPERMAGMSLSFGGVISTKAYLRAVCNAGFAEATIAEINENICQFY